jgi:hypothetical protein
MMKKLFLTVVLSFLFTLIGPGMVLAQRGWDPSDPPSDPRVVGPSEGMPTPIPGMIGVPESEPVNGPYTIDGNTSGGIGQGNTTTSGAGNSLRECSSIKFKSVIDILIWLKCIAVSVLIPLIFAAAFVVFLWGVLKFMYASDATKKKEGQKFIWYGLIGLFVMVSVWGIIKIVGTTLGIDPIAVPLLQTEYLDINKASR